MYEKLEPFYSIPSWSTLHYLDRKRFGESLAEIVHLPDFCSAKMGEHLSQYGSESIWADVDVDRKGAIETLVEEAEITARSIKDHGFQAARID